MVTFAGCQQYNAMMLLSTLPLVARRMFPKSDPTDPNEPFVTDAWSTDNYVAKAERKFQQTPQGQWTTARAI
jgi:hypothetical protein